MALIRKSLDPATAPRCELIPNEGITVETQTRDMFPAIFSLVWDGEHYAAALRAQEECGKGGSRGKKKDS